jgi:hypothetical protein
MKSNPKRRGWFNGARNIRRPAVSVMRDAGMQEWRLRDLPKSRFNPGVQKNQ